MDVDIVRMSRPVLVVIGPSAGGKSTAVRTLHERGVVHVHPTWTTRARRRDEAAGALEHEFVDDATFDALERDGFFLGTVQLPGLPFRYALPRPALHDGGPLDAVMARAPFVPLFADDFPNRLVYQIEDTRDRARARLIARGSDEREIDARLRGHDEEICAGRVIADRIFVNEGSLDGLVRAMTDALMEDAGMIGAVS